MMQHYVMVLNLLYLYIKHQHHVQVTFYKLLIDYNQLGNFRIKSFFVFFIIQKRNYRLDVMQLTIKENKELIDGDSF